MAVLTFSSSHSRSLALYRFSGFAFGRSVGGFGGGEEDRSTDEEFSDIEETGARGVLSVAVEVTTAHASTKSFSVLYKLDGPFCAGSASRSARQLRTKLGSSNNLTWTHFTSASRRFGSRFFGRPISWSVASSTRSAMLRSSAIPSARNSRRQVRLASHLAIAVARFSSGSFSMKSAT